MYTTPSQTHRNQQMNKIIRTKKTTSNTAAIATTTIPARAPVDSSVGGAPTFTSVNPALFNTPVLACVKCKENGSKNLYQKMTNSGKLANGLLQNFLIQKLAPTVSNILCTARGHFPLR